MEKMRKREKRMAGMRIRRTNVNGLYKNVWEFMHTNGVEIKDDITDVKYFRETDLTMANIFEVAETEDRVTKNEW